MISKPPKDVLLSVFFLFPVIFPSHHRWQTLFMNSRFWLHKTYIYRFFREKTMNVLKESFTTHSTVVILAVQCLGCVKWTLAKFPTITEYCNVYAGTWLVRWNERNHWIICSRMSWKQIFDCSTSFNVFDSWHELKFPRDKFLMKNRHA